MLRAIPGRLLSAPALGLSLLTHNLGAQASVSAGDLRPLTPAPSTEQSGTRDSRHDASDSLTLRDAIAQALSQHPLIEAARARQASARGARRTAGTIPNPIFTYWVEDARGLGRSANIPFDRETQTSVTFPLEPLFQRWPRVRQADAEVRTADAELSRAQQIVTLDASRAFFRVAAAQVAVDAAEELRARLAELTTFTGARVREGIAPEADFIRSRLELDRVAATVTLERVEWARARAALMPYLGRVNAVTTPLTAISRADVTGRATFRVVADADVPLPDAVPVASIASLMERARIARPELVAARERVVAARADVGYQRSLTVRQVGATIGMKQRAGLTSLMAGFSLPIPLFDQNRGEVQRTTGIQLAAEQELLWAERQIAAEVGAASDAAALLAAQMADLRGSFLSRAEESRQIAVAAYQDGAVSLLQVLDASRTVSEARLTYYRTLFAQRMSVLELNAAIGSSPLDASRSSQPRAPTTPPRSDTLSTIPTFVPFGRAPSTVRATVAAIASERRTARALKPSPFSRRRRHSEDR